MSVFPLLAILFLGFAISTNALTEAGSPTTTCLYKSAKQLTIDPKHAGTKVTTCSSLSCIETHCKAVKHCAVSFHPETGQCLGVSSKVLEALPELSKSGQLFKASKDGWLVIVSGDMAFNKASIAMKIMKAMKAMKANYALWPLDSENKGRNLGTKVDMDVTGVHWDINGPNGSKRKFARMTEKSKALVQLKKNGELALNLTSFTIAAWIKGDNKINIHIVRATGLDLQLYADTKQINIWHEIGYTTTSYSKYNFSSKYSWHHFAFVSSGVKTGTTIYVDGKPLKVIKKSYSSYINSALYTKLEIGNFYNRGVNHLGMACLFMSEAVFKPEEITQLKNSCP